jgi:hypothetical protein
VADDIGQAWWLSVLISMDGYDWVVEWVTNDCTLRSELRKVDLARCQVDLAKAFKNRLRVAGKGIVDASKFAKASLLYGSFLIT